jgi:geranylgeranyl diphosphate synthase, type II
MENSEYKQIYDIYLGLIESKIKSLCIGREPASVYEPINYLLQSGGKRIRPVLAMFSAEAVGGDIEEALNSAVALEILHNFTLVHDDIMDRSPLRRGRSTVHIKWDEATAILAGDLMVGLAYSLLPDHNVNEKSSYINRSFTEALIVVCEGQADDMDFSRKSDVTIDDYFEMIYKKTSKLIEASSVIGGYCGKGSDREINALREFARNIGLAFQLQDDMLDLISDTPEFGKSKGQDIIEGKKTFIMLTAHEVVNNQTDDRDSTELINRFFEEGGLNGSEFDNILNILNKYGILDITRSKIDEFINKASNSLIDIRPGRGKELITSLLNSLASRNY